MKWFVVFLCQLLVFIAADQHPNVNGAFGKRHTAGELMNPSGCNQASTSPSVSTLDLSKTSFSNGDIVDITWTPFSTVCKDDFIAIYSIDIPDSQGKR